ncbi:MFS transporter [Pseudomonas sp. DTU_2021_1001937_2_SI_NGA_ILE_001]|uniref:MFS transporter n=1 Tax=Pseudomonas sp. DTU_2021_1001937_2_SI_NGA_ILE_001 TaxID=3077589 RepID=UPI0028FC2ADA|nr:MFS transporter [Pseudomonas sp. DTU_2021_1001937_2_SI_NGA_ILE_001]WNW11849.1 MFS transporter [Pseudomonas sp. DTU_2021_1001937_2_SI_NGA_ILE_001]
MSVAQSTGLAPLRLAAIVLFAAIVPAVLMTAPAVATQYALQLGLNPARIGQLLSAELAVMSLATLPAYYWQRRCDWRRVAQAAAVLFIVTNLASAWTADYGLLMSLRILSALGGGTLMVVCIASAASSRQPERVYGLWVSGQLILGAVGLWLLPPLFASYGLRALYLGLAALMLACLPLATALPPRAQPPAPRPGQQPVARSRLVGVCALLAVLLFYVGLSAVWTFIGSIASAAAIDPTSSGRILSVATLLGIAGSLCATFIGARWPRPLLLVAGYGLMALAVALLLGLPDLARFAVAALLFKYTWTFALPFILACVADMDPQGRLMNSVNLVIGGGLALGPVLAGPLLESSLGMNAVLLGSIACLALSLSVLLAVRAGAPSPSSVTAPSGARP